MIVRTKHAHGRTRFRQTIGVHETNLRQAITDGALEVEYQPLADYLSGPTALTFVDGDVSAVAKALRDFSRGNPLLVIKGGLADGSLLSTSDLAALAELPLLLLDEGHCLRDQALDVCRTAGVRAELANTRAASLATAVQCVSGGLGVTLIPQSAVPVETARSRLELAYFAVPRPGRRIGLVFRSSSGREGPYRQLAGLIGELLADDQQVRPLG